MNRHEPDFLALALDAEMHDTLAALHVLHPDPAQLFAANAVIEQGGEDRPVAQAFQRIARRSIQQFPGLGVAEGRGAAFIIVRHRALDTIHRIASDGIALAEIVEQRRQGRELAPDTGGLQLPGFHVLAPGDDMRAGHGAQQRGFFQPGKEREFGNVDPVGAAGFLVGDIREPFELGRNLSEVAVLGRCQGSLGNRNQP